MVRTGTPFFFSPLCNNISIGTQEAGHIILFKRAVGIDFTNARQTVDH